MRARRRDLCAGYGESRTAITWWDLMTVTANTQDFMEPHRTVGLLAVAAFDRWPTRSGYVPHEKRGGILQMRC
jgi:hypothetical protein